MYSNEVCAHPINLDHLANSSGDIITFDLFNGDLTALTFRMGTPFASPVERVGVGGGALGEFNGAALATDRFGAGNPFVVTLAQRVMRNPLIITQMDIITAGDEPGQLQRGNRITRTRVDYDANECQTAGRFRTFFTENNYVRTNELIILSEKWGFEYDIDPVQRVQIDMTIGAAPIYNYGDEYGQC